MKIVDRIASGDYEVEIIKGQSAYFPTPLDDTPYILHVKVGVSMKDIPTLKKLMLIKFAKRDVYLDPHDDYFCNSINNLIKNGVIKHLLFRDGDKLKTKIVLYCGISKNKGRKKKETKSNKHIIIPKYLISTIEDIDMETLSTIGNNKLRRGIYLLIRYKNINGEGFFLSNQEIADTFNCSKYSVNEYIGVLKKLELIKIHRTYNPNKRRIFLNRRNEDEKQQKN